MGSAPGVGCSGSRASAGSDRARPVRPRGPGPSSVPTGAAEPSRTRRRWARSRGVARSPIRRRPTASRRGRSAGTAAPAVGPRSPAGSDRSPGASARRSPFVSGPASGRVSGRSGSTGPDPTKLDPTALEPDGLDSSRPGCGRLGADPAREGAGSTPFPPRAGSWELLHGPRQGGQQIGELVLPTETRPVVVRRRHGWQRHALGVPPPSVGRAAPERSRPERSRPGTPRRGRAPRRRGTVSTTWSRGGSSGEGNGGAATGVGAGRRRRCRDCRGPVDEVTHVDGGRPAEAASALSRARDSRACPCRRAASASPRSPRVSAETATSCHARAASSRWPASLSAWAAVRVEAASLPPASARTRRIALHARTRAGSTGPSGTTYRPARGPRRPGPARRAPRSVPRPRPATAGRRRRRRRVGPRWRSRGR